MSGGISMLPDCGADWAAAPAPTAAFCRQLNAMDGRFFTQGRVKKCLPYIPRIARRASASPISTNAEVTSGPPTRIRVGVFILFHS
jgi:hypothetical protein